MWGQGTHIGKYPQLVLFAVKQILHRFPGIVGNRYRGYRNITHPEWVVTVDNAMGEITRLLFLIADAASGDIDVDIESGRERHYPFR